MPWGPPSSYRLHCIEWLYRDREMNKAVPLLSLVMELFGKTDGENKLLSTQAALPISQYVLCQKAEFNLFLRETKWQLAPLLLWANQAWNRLETLRSSSPFLCELRPAVPLSVPRFPSSLCFLKGTWSDALQHASLSRYWLVVLMDGYEFFQCIFCLCLEIAT